MDMKHSSTPTVFNRQELSVIFALYSRMVSAGTWKDYALDFMPDAAIFSIFRKATEYPLYSIEKRPKNKNRQGAYAVIAPGGLIMKRGHDLSQVLRVLDKARFRAV